MSIKPISPIFSTSLSSDPESPIEPSQQYTGKRKRIDSSISSIKTDSAPFSPTASKDQSFEEFALALFSSSTRENLELESVSEDPLSLRKSKFFPDFTDETIRPKDSAIKDGANDKTIPKIYLQFAQMLVEKESQRRSDKRNRGDLAELYDNGARSSDPLPEENLLRSNGRALQSSAPKQTLSKNKKKRKPKISNPKKVVLGIKNPWRNPELLNIFDKVIKGEIQPPKPIKGAKIDNNIDREAESAQLISFLNVELNWLYLQRPGYFRYQYCTALGTAYPYSNREPRDGDVLLTRLNTSQIPNLKPTSKIKKRNPDLKNILKAYTTNKTFPAQVITEAWNSNQKGKSIKDWMPFLKEEVQWLQEECPGYNVMDYCWAIGIAYPHDNGERRNGGTLYKTGLLK